MKIQDNEIASVEPFGMLDGKPVKLVRLKGGLNMATSTDAKGAENVLGAASHQAILCYTIEQRFPNFQPMLMKSETGMKLEAESHSHFLTDDLRKSGHDIYSIQNGNEVDFFITQQNIKKSHTKAVIANDKLEVEGSNWDKMLVQSLSGAVAEKALSIGLKGVKVK
ncbi:MAG TPA: hypothetical protein VIJ14_11130 [Rhabdochlamydiaceae bacterium]